MGENKLNPICFILENEIWTSEKPLWKFPISLTSDDILTI